MIAAIVAMDKNGAIGQGNQMPWHLPNDLRYFKNTTQNSVVIMGRKTFESIGKKLPNRVNIILTRNSKELNENNTIEDLFFFDDFERALTFSKSLNKDIFITGGAEIYKQYIHVCEYIFVTHIDAELNPVDAYFPMNFLENCRLLNTQKYKKDEKNDYAHEFSVYKKV